MITSRYSKPTDSEQYLIPSQVHKQNVVDNIPKTVGIRLRTLCSDRVEGDRIFADALDEYRAYMEARRYDPMNIRGHFAEIARRDLGQERSELLLSDIRGKCKRLRFKMSRNHEQKMKHFYQLGDFDKDDEDFRILRNRIEGLLDKVKGKENGKKTKKDKESIDWRRTRK